MPISRVEALSLEYARVIAQAAYQARLKAMEMRLDEIGDAMAASIRTLGYGEALIEEILLFQRAIDASILDRPHEIDMEYPKTIYAHVPRRVISPGAWDFLEHAYEQAGWFLIFHCDRHNPFSSEKHFTLVRGFDIAEKEQYLAETEPPKTP